MTETAFSDYLTVSDVAKALDLSVVRIHQLVNEGRITPVKTPLGNIFSPHEIERVRLLREERKNG